MSFKKNQKKYNKQVMQTGLEANQYMRNALGLINKYTTDYSGRNDFWTNKLNDRQLNLLSDKYLAQNANMLRGQAAFGSNSKTNQQINENAYSQQNYLANVANQNVMNANTLQQNELQALMNASNTYQKPIQSGASAAQNVDAANGAWFNAIGKGMQGAGSVLQAIPTPMTQAIGGALNTTGGIMTGLTSDTTSLTPDQQKNLGGIAMTSTKGFSNWLGTGALANKLGVGSSGSSTLGGSSSSGVSGTSDFNPNFSGFKRLGNY